MKQRYAVKLILRILAALAGICLLALAALYLIGGGLTKPLYLEPWDAAYAGRFDDPRVRLAAVGLLAANNHNMQPWTIMLDEADDTAFFLYADSSRTTPEADPLYRQMMVTQGTFLEYIAVATQTMGYAADITLFPEGEYDESDILRSMDEMPVAEIKLAKTDPADSPLYHAIFLPDTNRAAYAPDALTPAQTSGLLSLAQGSVSVTLYTDAPSVKTIGEYAMNSAAVEAGVARVMAESGALFRSNESRKNDTRYGFSLEGQGTAGFMKYILQGLVTLFPSMNEGEAASRNYILSAQTSVDNTPAYAMITSTGNTRAEQVQSGMLYSRMVLTAHTLGLALQPLSQVLEEYAEMQALYAAFQQAYAPTGGAVQMLVRVGTPTKSTPLTMRRSVESLLSR